jgi:hypothetical protein
MRARGWLLLQVSRACVRIVAGDRPRQAPGVEWGADQSAAASSLYLGYRYRIPKYRANRLQCDSAFGADPVTFFCQGRNVRRRRARSRGHPQRPRQRQHMEARVLKLLLLLVVITMGCGVATGLTIAVASSQVEDSEGY